MPFPPINLHQRISSPGRELFRRKKAPPPPQTELLLKSKPRDEEKHFSERLSASWTSANLKNLGRKPQQQKTKAPLAAATTTSTTQGPLLAAGQEARRAANNKDPCWLTGVPRPQDSSCDALTLVSSSVEESSASASQSHRSSRQSSRRGSLGKPEQDIQFTLSLTPEAILVIQKRNLEKQQKMTANNKQQGGGAGDFSRHRRVYPSSSSKKAHGAHGGHQTHHHNGASRSGVPVAKLPEQQPDITAIVKISLLNDQYKYDDVEYEEEDGDAVDETVVRKCREWLKGVESAAAFNGKQEKLSVSALPHLKGC